MAYSLPLQSALAGRATLPKDLARLALRSGKCERGATFDKLQPAVSRPIKLILQNHQAPGDILMLTAAVRDLHLAVPGDVSVVGFDDIDLAPHVDPPLTTVHQPIRRKGEEAVRLLLTVVERRDQAKPEHRRLETRLIVRGSTGPVPLLWEEVAGDRD